MLRALMAGMTLVCSGLVVGTALAQTQPHGLTAPLELRRGPAVAPSAPSIAAQPPSTGMPAGSSGQSGQPTDTSADKQPPPPPPGGTPPAAK
jgi:hypothetical protein